MRSDADLAAIALELDTDPNLLGYLPNAQSGVNDPANSDAMNLVRDSIEIGRTTISSDELLSAVDLDDYRVLPDADRDYLSDVFAQETVVVASGAEIRRALIQIFPSGTVTFDNLILLLTANANRVEQMWEEDLLEVGGTVTTSDIADSRRV